MINVPSLIGSHDIVFLTLDTLRYDVARDEFAAGRTPQFAALFPHGWEERHSPASFTYAAHQAFFAGFLPTPARPGKHPRHFAARFAGSETSTAETFVFDAPDIVTGLRNIDYHTICIGGVGFFNRQTALSRVLPDLFDESHWSPALGVTEPDSTRYQFGLAVERLRHQPRRVFLFINVAALHQPNFFYLDGASHDSRESHAAALRYVDSQLPPLLDALRTRGPSLVIACADHGTAYGDDGYHGHRIGHPSVWTVPYAETLLPERS